jgi:hypothetical protein
MTDQARSRVLIAAPSSVYAELEDLLQRDADVAGAATYGEAVYQLNSDAIDLLILCYVFDEVRPYRLLNYLQDAGKRLPTVLVRAVAVPLRRKDSEIEEAYASLGVDKFYNLTGESQRLGRDTAFERFRECVLGELKRGAAGARQSVRRQA